METFIDSAGGVVVIKPGFWTTGNSKSAADCIRGFSDDHSVELAGYLGYF